MRLKQKTLDTIVSIESKLLAGIIIALMVWGVVVYVGDALGFSKDKNKSKVESQYIPGKDTFGAWCCAQQFVERDLIAPSTAKFESDRHSDKGVKYLGNDTYLVRSYVDSQNGFGAMIRTKYILKIKQVDQGKSWQLVGDITYYY